MISSDVSRIITRAAVLLFVGMQSLVVVAQEVSFVRITGDRPSVFSRPIIDDQFLIGQVSSGDEFLVLREQATELPQPFYQIEYHSEVGWIYGGSVETFQRRHDDVTPDQLAAIQDAGITAEERVSGVVRDLLVAYETERERVVSEYDLGELPQLDLWDEGAFQVDYVANRLEAHFEVTGTRDRLLLVSADRLFFQIVLVSLLERVSAVESCRLVLHFSDRRLDPMVTLTREQWENATDFSAEGFWRLVETENADRLWEEP